METIPKDNSVYNIETRECGVWETVKIAHSELEAAQLASKLTLTTREEWVRVDNSCPII